MAATLIAALTAPAGARGTIAQVGIPNRAPAAGQRIEFQVAVTAPDAAGLKAGAYGVQVEVRTADGAQIAATEPVVGTSDVTPDRGVVLVPSLELPNGLNGNFTVTAILLEGGAATERSDPQSLVIGGIATAPAAAPAPNSPAATGFALDGSFTSNHDIAGGRVGQNGLLSLDGKLDQNTSFSASGGITTAGGGNKPLISVRTKQSQTQFGTFAPSFDPSVFDGPSGLALSYRAAPDDRSALQFAYLSGARGSLNPYNAFAVNETLPIGKVTKFGITTGAFNVSGDPASLTGEPQPNAGTFLGLSVGREQGASRFGYGLRYGLQWYRDKLGRSFAENAIAATANLLTGKASWAFDFHRGSAFFTNLLAPGVTPDRQNAHVALNVPFGVVTTSFSVSADADDLNSTKAQRNRAVTESFSLTAPLKNGDSLTYSLNGSTAHIGADPLVSATATNTASAGDSQNIGYNARRGLYTFGYTLGYTNQHDNQSNTTHSTQNGISVSRAVTTGLNVTANVNLNTNVSGNSASTSSGLSGTLGLGYALGPLNLTGSFGTSRTRPFLGLRPEDAATMNLGLKFLQSKNFSVQAGFTQTAGAGSTTQTGTINATQRF
ncbi:MAG: hypothetical protein GIW95_02145 [Candidatus Eremiobacteraeota bacterium]|nr:hypothetical protein [Candidatus Eremiobacteraeota bacterium]